MGLRFYLGLGPIRAALPLTLLLAACGSTTGNADAGIAGAHAGTAAGGGDASGGSAIGGSSGTSGGAAGRESGGGAAGHESSGGTAGSESGGGAAGRNQAGAGSSAGSVCPGSMLDPARATTPRCSSVADCEGLKPPIFNPVCQTTPPVYECGGIQPPHECETDANCGTGRVCNHSGCGGALCAEGCPTKACADYENCASGRCVLKACDAAGALPCGAGTECKSTNGAPATCTPIRCDAGFACAPTWDCAPGPTADPHGCVQRACRDSSDCACGFCVSGRCEPTPGYCFAYAPPP